MEIWSSKEARRKFAGKINNIIEVDILDDTGCDGLVFSRAFCLKNNLTIRKGPRKVIQVADGKTQILENVCSVRLRVNNWEKENLTFSVADINEDLILGTPFRETICITNDDWENRYFQFKTRAGTEHTWYGIGNDDNTEFCSVGSFEQLSKNDEVFNIHIYDPTSRINSINNNTSTQENKELIDEFLKKLDPKIRVIVEEYLDTVFADPVGISETPERIEDMEINLKPGTQPSNQPLRRFSAAEDELIREKLDELLSKGWIKPSKSEFGANLLFAKKKDGGYRMCIDYRDLNNCTIPDRTPLPSHNGLRDSVVGCEYLSKVDIRDAFHMIRIKEQDTHKTAFKTKFGLFEYTVTPFGFTNSPGTFMRMMNRIFGDLIDNGANYYVDDILVYSKSYEGHLLLIETVLKRLKDNNLHVKLSKCEFNVKELDFCGVRVSSDGYAIN